MTILDHHHKWLKQSQLIGQGTDLFTDFVDYLDCCGLIAEHSPETENEACSYLD